MNDFRLAWDGSALLGLRSGVGNYTGYLLSALMAQDPEWQFHFYSKQPLQIEALQLSRAVWHQGYLRHSHLLWLQTVLPWLLARDAPDLGRYN